MKLLWNSIKNSGLLTTFQSAIRYEGTVARWHEGMVARWHKANKTPDGMRPTEFSTLIYEYWETEIPIIKKKWENWFYYAQRELFYFYWYNLHWSQQYKNKFTTRPSAIGNIYGRIKKWFNSKLIKASYLLEKIPITQFVLSKMIPLIT